VTGGFVSAHPGALTRWRVDGGQMGRAGELLAPSALPGPVVAGADPAVVAWGPVLVRDGAFLWSVDDLVIAALADLGSGAARRFRLHAGAAAPDGSRVALDLRMVKPRTDPEHAPAMPALRARLAVIEIGTGEVEQFDDGTEPTAIAWAGDRLLLGDRGAVEVVGTGDRFDLHDPTSGVSAIAVAADGRIAVGLASGGIATFGGADGSNAARWDAHTTSVTALAWGGDELISGAYDGAIQVWDGDAGAARVDAGARVDAVAAVGNAVVAKAGGQGGRLLLLAP
jgi:hypothetical protein